MLSFFVKSGFTVNLFVLKCWLSKCSSNKSISTVGVMLLCSSVVGGRERCHRLQTWLTTVLKVHPQQRCKVLPRRVSQRRQVVGKKDWPKYSFSVLFFYYIGKKICELPSRITKINIFNPCISIYRSTHAPNSSIYYLKVSNKETTQNLPLKL